MNHPYAEIELQIKRTIDYLIAVADARTEADYGALHMQILNAVHAQMNQLYQDFQAPDHITADKVCLQVQDQESGRVYKRDLPLDYHENNNGIKLSGEDFHGAASEITFLSASAIQKMNDLLGHGPDQSPCDHN